MPIRIAIVEDETAFAETLQRYLQRFTEEYGNTFQVQTFTNAIALLEPYSASYDMIFMDIQMPYLNGMDAAHRLRELDQKVLLLFITSLTQYAVSGYEVDALDYIVKPVNYYDFALKLNRAIKRLPKEDVVELIVSTNQGMVRLNSANIRYIETEGHHVVYHTTNGDYMQYSTLQKLEEKLTELGFARCNSCYLVNLQYVLHVKGYTAVLDTCELKISQPRKKKFMQQFHSYAAHVLRI
jgi:DNA-binding LytR/AlgR family response regulator